MMNPIALLLIAFGVLLMLLGLLFAGKGRKTAGILVLVLGLVVTAIPFAITFYLGSNL